MFDRNSAIVKMWVDQLLDGRRQPNEVPALSNLKTIVISLYNEMKNTQEEEL